MNAAQFNDYGPTDVLEITSTAEIPQIADDQVLVEVHSASINPVEAAIRNGYMKEMIPLTFPVTTGGDFSGVVTQVGENVTEFSVGDEVFGLANHYKGGSGSVAEFVAANAVNTAKKPQSVDHTQAAALPLVATSAVQALNEHIKLQPEQKILIHGGAGGIGSLAIQLAKTQGAYVTATASTDDLAFIKELGADETIDYKTQDFTSLVNDYDAVFDTVGGDTTNKSISVLKKGGILVSMAGQADSELAEKQGVTAITQGTKGSTAQLTTVAMLVDSGKLKPIIDTVFSIDETKKAYDLLENGHPRGKVVIAIKE